MDRINFTAEVRNEMGELRIVGKKADLMYYEEVPIRATTPEGYAAGGMSSLTTLTSTPGITRTN